jgi:hypothetical protein
VCITQYQCYNLGHFFAVSKMSFAIMFTHLIIRLQMLEEV